MSSLQGLGTAISNLQTMPHFFSMLNVIYLGDHSALTN